MLLVLLLSLAVDGQMFGTLKSPDFPDPYPRDTVLRWNLSVPDGFRIKLYFSHFHLEPSYLCEYDYVKVRPRGIMGRIVWLFWIRVLDQALRSGFWTRSLDQDPDLGFWIRVLD